MTYHFQLREAIRSALERDENFQAYGEAGKPLAEYLCKIPEILPKWLDKPVTMQNLYLARVELLQYELENGILPTLIDAMGGGLFALMADMMEPMIKNVFDTQINDAKRLAKSWKRHLAKTKETERDVLKKDFQFSRDALKAYDKGNMTFADLLAIQPMVIHGYPNFQGGAS